MQYGILFIYSLFYEYITLELVRVAVEYRVNQAEYVIFCFLWLRPRKA